MIKCLVCGQEFSTRLGSHVKTHMSIKEYYDRYLKKENEGICLVCGKETTFKGLTKGYAEHCSVKCKGKDPKVKQKVKQTCLEKFGATNVYASEYGKQKIKSTNIERYGVENPQQNEEIKLKTQCTNLKKYGAEYTFQSKFIKEKINKTNLEKYGTITPTAFGSELYKQNMIKNFGVDNPLKSEEIKEKVRATNIERYGFDNPAKNEEIKQKMHDTLWKNGGYTKAEDRCYNLLLEKYPEALRNYKSEKYPYRCDFYIPSLDLYIELNAFYMHGGHWYNENDPKDIEQVEKWKKQNTEQSIYAIHIWTESDLAKKKCAEENKLNYLVCWSEEEFMSIFDRDFSKHGEAILG